MFGHIRWDNEECIEDHFPFHSTHFHSLDEWLIVGDWAYHCSTSNNQHAHCHPRFTPDGKAVLYTSDLTAYSNMYLVEIGNFDMLPDLE